MKHLILILVAYLFTGASNDYCSDFEKRVDKFTGVTSYHTSYLKNLTFCKRIDTSKNDAYCYILIYLPNSFLTVKGEGVYFLLSDGSKISYPSEDIKVDYSTATGNYNYSASIFPTDDELKRMRESHITAFKLYIFDKDLNTKDQEAYKAYANCLENLK